MTSVGSKFSVWTYKYTNSSLYSRPIRW